MCFGYDGEAALRASLEAKGASRRSLFRGAAVGAAGLAAVGSMSSAPAYAGRGHGGHGGGRAVPHEDISIQMWTVRDAVGDGAGLVTVLDALARYGYEKIELAGLYDRTAAEMRDLLDERDLRASSSHDGLSNRDRGAIHAKFANAVTLGQRYVVVPFLNGTTLDYWEDAVEQMNAEAAIARRYGLRYGYHNHAHEFTIELENGQTPWEVLTSQLDPRLVHLEVDLYWVYTGGVESHARDPLRFAIEVIRDAPQRVRQYHVKDSEPGGTAEDRADMCDLGTGVIDFARIFRSHSVEEYIVENDTPDVTPLTTAAVGHLYLDHLRY